MSRRTCLNKAVLALLALLLVLTPAHGLALPHLGQLKEKLLQQTRDKLEFASDSTATTHAAAKQTSSSTADREASRTRRTLSDVVSIDELEPARQFIPNDDISAFVNVDEVADFFPTTRAQDMTFFQVTDSNAGTVNPILGDALRRDACLAVASSQKCLDDACSVLSSNDVTQPVYSWQPAVQAWTDAGPGAATTPATGVITGNGVVALAHFSPDGVQDMILPSSFTSDASAKLKPTEQCGAVWRYQGEGQGYHKYQDCAWLTNGARHVEPFTLGGEQFIVQTNMVQRSVFAGTIIEEQFSSVPNFILKWSSRTTNNTGTEHPHGFFLSGGEYSNGTLDPGDARYNTSIGNNGANVWQVFGTLSGVAHAHVFEIRGETFLAFAEYISDEGCEVLDATSTFPSCWDVEIESHIFKYDPRRENPRGDCVAPGQPAGCQGFEGEFTPYQSIRTNGARHITAFSVTTTGNVEHFLAVAESHANDLTSSLSSIYRWNGVRFGLFQQLDTFYAENIEYFEIEGQGHLAVTNRGCPPLERNVSFAACGTDDAARAGRTQVYLYDVFSDRFRMVEESEELGELHAYDSTSDGDGGLIFERGGQSPVGLAVFRLPFFNLLGFTDTFTYIAVANERILETDRFGSCPSSNPRACSHPQNIFRVRDASTLGIASSVTQISQVAQDAEQQIDTLTAQLNGGGNLTTFLAREYGLDLRLYGASSSVDMNVGGRQYVIVGFEEAYMTVKECLALYANHSSPMFACPHLGENATIANETLCRATCGEDSLQYEPVVRHHSTETIVFRVVRGGARPRLEEVQRLPSLGVTALEVFHTEPNITQEVYDTCTQSMNPSSCLSDNRNSSRDSQHTVLAVINTKSTCEMDYVSGSPLPPDPQRSVDLYRFDRSSKRFVKHNSISTVCQPTAVASFTIACQSTVGVHVEPPACAQYLAISEDCNSYNAYLSATGAPASLRIPGNHRVGFHILADPSSMEYQRCQPYPDPGDPRNRMESPCHQSPDPLREPGTAASGDEHAYDFPDLLPEALVVGSDLTDDGTGYFPRLREQPVASLAVGVPRAQKSVFFKEDRGTDNPSAVEDFDAQPRSPYWLNGRKRFELVLSVTYNGRRRAPQVFGLRALHPRSSACVGRHATTPIRRSFDLTQSMNPSATSGGKGAVFFERPTSDGSTKTFAVFAERYSRTQADPGIPAGRRSSLYVDDVCDEYTQLTSQQMQALGIDGAGVFAPAPNILPDVDLPEGDTEWCPYSTHPHHFLAWEAFENHYHPVSPCKGRSYDRDGPSFGVQQRYYNRLPPASMRSPLTETVEPSPRAGFAYPRRPENITVLSTFQFSPTDYLQLFYGKDETMAKLQDLPSYQANDVESVEVCGASNQFWLVFANDGWDVEFGSDGRPISGVAPPAQKRYLYRWNERYAVGDDGASCTAAAARDEISLRGAAVARLGCFETVELVIPVNSGRALSINMFAAHGWYVMLQFNVAEGERRDISPQLCAADGSTKGAPGVVSYSAALDLHTHGGTTCRVYLQEETLTTTRLELEDMVEETFSETMAAVEQAVALATTQGPPLNLTQLDDRYVTLHSDQAIAGTKTFAALTADSIAVNSDLAVDGELDVSGKTTIDGDVDVFGTVDGVDISVFTEQVAAQTEDTAQKFLELSEISCSLQLSEGGGGQQCIGVTRSTRCYPKQSLKAEGLAALYADVASTAQAQLTAAAVDATVDRARMYLQSRRAYLVLSAETVGNLTLAVAALNLSDYFTPSYCLKEPEAPVSPGYMALTRPVRFLLLSCSMWGDQVVINDLKLALAAELSLYAVRRADITVSNVECNDDGTSTLRLQLQVASDFSADVASELQTLDLWTGVYVALEGARPSVFAPVAEVVEYDADAFAPPESTFGEDDASGDVPPGE